MHDDSERESKSGARMTEELTTAQHSGWERTYYPAMPAKASATYLHRAARIEHTMEDRSETARNAPGLSDLVVDTLGMRRARKVVRLTAMDK